MAEKKTEVRIKKAELFRNITDVMNEERGQPRLVSKKLPPFPRRYFIVSPTRSE